MEIIENQNNNNYKIKNADTIITYQVNSSA